jgi:anti-anti-sigma regulatory factor
MSNQSMDHKIKGFSAHVDKHNSSLTINLVGSLTAEDQLPDISLLQTKELLIDVSKLTYMNSGGVDKWLKWIKAIKTRLPDVKWVFTNVSSSFVRQASVISGFIPEGSYLVRFNISYYCAHCDKLNEISFDRGTDISHFSQIQSKEFRWPTVTCSQCQNVMEVDCLLEHYRPLFAKTNKIEIER